VKFAVTLAAVIAATSAAHAQAQQAGQGGCITYLDQTVCSPVGGVILVELGQVICARGQCISTMGQIICSSQPGGYVTYELGQAKCTGGRERASASYCQRPQ
jgi:hypothetical protein